MTLLRCAIYTRKSSEEGLEQDFNSLDAQREACEAFIASQKGEGWRTVSDRFDDGGFSGGSMERPALQRLLGEIRAGRIDVVVVYKVDRLTRSLSDFAKIVEVFDAHSTSFVSVTQQFNTTTSMGRLTLNVLLSFAQFEREVTGERIRDKIAASKKKGMWMGGNVPLGYEVKDRALLVSEAEAQTVRELFDLYLEKGCVREAWVEASRRRYRTKTGKPFSQGHFYRILRNPIYVGEIRHREKRYPGLHQAIVDRETWMKVQGKLAENRIEHANSSRAREPSLLRSKLFDDKGRPFTPSHAVKKGRRYRYYIERDGSTPPVTGKRPRRKRIAAAEIETIVADQLLHLLRAPRKLITAIGVATPTAAQSRTAAEASVALADELGRDPAFRHDTVRRLIDRVVLADEVVRIEVDRQTLAEALDVAGDPSGPRHHTIEVKARLRVRGTELRFAITDSDGALPAQLDPSLIRVIVRAHDWWDRLLTGEASSLRSLALAEGVTDRYVRRLLDFAFLAPDVTAAILDARQPVDLTAESLTTETRLPVEWADQRRLLGFEPV